MAALRLSQAVALTALLAVSVARADSDEDPGAGQSWLTRLAEHETREGRLYAGTIRATDDYSATHDRDFRLSVSGDTARGDRKVVLNRYEPECFDLAPAARMTLDEYCDQVTLTWRGDDAEIAFSSLDANRRYAFTMRRDPRAPDDWASVPPAMAAPTLRLSNGISGDGVSYRWELGTEDTTYRQAGEVSAAMWRGTDLSPLEASLMGLGEVLMTFNRYAFVRSSLPREHPDYQATPYALWAEETVEGGCIFSFCFGNLGGGGGNAGNPSDGICEEHAPGYNTTACPHDLTYARWPISMRPKIRRGTGEEEGWFHVDIWLKNKGSGIFLMPTPTPDLAFVTVIKMFGPTSAYPVSNYPPASNEHCAAVSKGFGYGPLYPWPELEAGGSTPLMTLHMYCEETHYVDGRYQLHITVDPAGTADSPGYAGNNVGRSWDWIRL